MGKGQLATVRLTQGRYSEALTAYEEARATFERLHEPSSVAAAWQLIGIVHKHEGRFDLAEQAYRQSLAILVRTQAQAGQAQTLGNLGNLYHAWGRLEYAVTFYRQAADALVKLQDLRSEGRVRSNLADTLIELQRYDEARRELLRAIECNTSLGHAVEPWKTWDILCDLEKATGNYPAANVARQKAIETYLLYRRAGGVSQHNRYDVFDLVAQALRQGQAEAMLQQLTEISAEHNSDWAKSRIAKLQAILHGDRSASVVDDPDLDYTTAAELQLLLEQNPLPNT